ncbi:MAG: response regulator [Thermodesulfobacteriota bacterium]
MSNKILVVDDEPKILQVVSAYLEKEGYQVFTASNGKEYTGWIRSAY